MPKSRIGPETPAEVLKIVRQTFRTIVVEPAPGFNGDVGTAVFMANVLALQRGKNVEFLWNRTQPYRILTKKAGRWLREQLRTYLRRIAKEVGKCAKTLDALASDDRRFWYWRVPQVALGAAAELRRLSDEEGLRYYLSLFPELVFDARPNSRGKVSRVGSSLDRALESAVRQQRSRKSSRS